MFGGSYTASSDFEQFDRDVHSSQADRLAPLAGKADGVTACDSLAGRVVRKLRAGLIRVVEVERLGRALTGVIEIAERRKLRPSQPLGQPPPLPAVCCLDRPLRFAVAVLVVGDGIFALVNEGARKAGRHHGERCSIMYRARHQAVTRSRSLWSGRAPIFWATKRA